MQASEREVQIAFAGDCSWTRPSNSATIWIVRCADRSVKGTSGCIVSGIGATSASGAATPAAAGPVSATKGTRRVFRQPVHTGRRGRPRLLPEQGLLIGQRPEGARKQYAQRHVVSVSRRIVQGSAQAISAVLAAIHSGAQINTAYIERLNRAPFGRFRSALAPLARRADAGRRAQRDPAAVAIAPTATVLTAGMYLVGAAYNCCWTHASLRQLAPPDASLKWQERTPAMAAGLTNHRWTLSKLLHHQVPLPMWVPPKRRGRLPKASKLSALGAAA